MHATVKIRAIGVNRIDLLKLTGQYPSIDKNKIPGIEVAGTRLDTGERVFALLTSGGYSKEIRINKNLYIISQITSIILVQLQSQKQ